jgi:hypothetical protein
MFADDQQPSPSDILSLIPSSVSSAADRLCIRSQFAPRRAFIDLENPREVLRVLDSLASAIIESQNEAVYA